MEMMMMRKIGKQAGEMKNNSEVEATSRAAYAQRGTKDVKIKRNHTTLNYKYFDKIFKEYLHAILTISASLHHESLNDSFAQFNVLLTIHQNTKSI